MTFLQRVCSRTEADEGNFAAPRLYPASQNVERLVGVKMRYLPTPEAQIYSETRKSKERAELIPRHSFGILQVLRCRVGE